MNAAVDHAATVLADWLRRERLERGLTQKDLADRLSWRSPQRVSNIERGLERLSLKEAAKYCDALGVRDTAAVQRLLLTSLEDRLDSLFAQEPGRRPEP